MALAAAQSDNLAASSSAISGIVALCHDFSVAGAEHLTQVRAFMLLTLAQAARFVLT